MKKIHKIIRDKKGRFLSGYHSSQETEFKKGNYQGYGFKKGHTPWNKEFKDIMPIPWNKNLTKETDERVRKISESQLGEKNHMYGRVGERNPMYMRGYLISGEKHGMFSKHHPKEIIRKISKNTKIAMNNLLIIEKIKEARAKQIFLIKDTSIELKIQNYLKLLHIGFVTHYYISEITHSYQCDILIPKQETEGVIIPQKTIIECDGCYWHGCKICNKYFNNLQEEHIKRDKIRTSELINKGYKVIRLWEHDIKKTELNDLKEKLI